MLIVVELIRKALKPYLNMLKKDLALTGLSAITMSYVPNLIGHPLGLIVISFLGKFSLPENIIFFLCWFGVVITAGLISIFKVIGLLNTNFFLTQTIGNLGFVSSSFFAFLLLGETLSPELIFSYILAIIGVFILSWHKSSNKKFVLDKGMLFTVLAVILYGLSFVLYKLSTLYVPDYSSFLTGRFIGDLLFWGIVWFFVGFITKKKPLTQLKNILRAKKGKILIITTVIISLVASWVIYKLPVNTLALLSTISFPVSYFISYFKYKEKITFNIWVGTLFILLSIITFILF